MDRKVNPNDFKDLKTTIKNVGKAILIFALVLIALYLLGQ